MKLEQSRQLKTEITTRSQEIEKLKADIDKMDKRLREKNERIPNANDVSYVFFLFLFLLLVAKKLSLFL